MRRSKARFGITPCETRLTGRREGPLEATPEEDGSVGDVAEVTLGAGVGLDGVGDDAEVAALSSLPLNVQSPTRL